MSESGFIGATPVARESRRSATHETIWVLCVAAAAIVSDLGILADQHLAFLDAFNTTADDDRVGSLAALAPGLEHAAGVDDVAVSGVRGRRAMAHVRHHEQPHRVVRLP